MSDPYDDPYDKGTGGKPGKPAVSWKKADPGDEFTGIVVAPDVNLPEKGYAVSQEWETDDDGNRYPLVWAPPNYMRNGKPWRGPVREIDYTAHVGSAEGARKVTRPDIMFETDYSKFEFVSGPARQRITDEGGSDDGVRRIIIGGQSIREAHEAALEAIGTDRPQVGQRWTVRLDHQEPTAQGGHKNHFKVTIVAPTPETLDVAAKSLARRKAEAEAGDDPYAGGRPAGQTEEPPF